MNVFLLYLAICETKIEIGKEIVIVIEILIVKRKGRETETGGIKGMTEIGTEIEEEVEVVVRKEIEREVEAEAGTLLYW